MRGHTCIMLIAPSLYQLTNPRLNCRDKTTKLIVDVKRRGEKGKRKILDEREQDYGGGGRNRLLYSRKVSLRATRESFPHEIWAAIHTYIRF